MSFRSTWGRLVGFLSARRSDSELDDEMAAHLQLAADDLKARGMDEQQAQRQARLQFGGVTQTCESYRNQRGWPLVESVAADLRFCCCRPWRWYC
jgi:hypothetical protein